MGRCTFAEAEFPLQKQANPVDRDPYKTNTRAQEAIAEFVESMESDGIIKKRKAQGDHLSKMLETNSSWPQRLARWWVSSRPSRHDAVPSDVES